MTNPEISRSAMLTITIAVEALLLLTATVWRFFDDIPLAPYLIPDPKAMLWGLLIGISTASVSWICYALGNRFKLLSGFRNFSKDFIAPLVSVLTWTDIILLAIISGFCEEILFRGIIQKKTGLIMSSLAFGIFHDPSCQQKSYIISAIVTGLILGTLYLKTGSLWAPIMAHVMHNAISLLILRYKLKQG